jgi:hypothetical protein
VCEFRFWFFVRRDRRVSRDREEDRGKRLSFNPTQTHTLLDVLCALCDKRVVSFDVLAVAAVYDKGVSAVVAAKVMFEVLCQLEKARKGYRSNPDLTEDIALVALCTVAIFCLYPFLKYK